jgi:hypothetical protein
LIAVPLAPPGVSSRVSDPSEGQSHLRTGGDAPLPGIPAGPSGFIDPSGYYLAAQSAQFIWWQAGASLSRADFATLSELQRVQQKAVTAPAAVQGSVVGVAATSTSGGLAGAAMLGSALYGFGRSVDVAATYVTGGVDAPTHLNRALASGLGQEAADRWETGLDLGAMALGVAGGAIHGTRGLFGGRGGGGNLIHLTDAAGEAGIMTSNSLNGRRGVFAVPAYVGSESTALKVARTGLIPAQTSNFVSVPQAATGLFRRPVPIGPYSAWKYFGGVRFSPPGSVSMSTGAFSRDRRSLGQEP